MRPKLLYAHIGAVSLAGGGVLAWLIVAGTGTPLRSPGVLAALAVMLVASEQQPLVVVRRNERSAITLSAIFACALLLRWPVEVAVVVQAAACLVEDLRAGRSWWKSTFNVGQYSLALFAAGAVCRAFGGAGAEAHLTALGMLAALATGSTFFVVNTLLTGTAVAVAEGVPLSRLLASDLAFQASVNGTMACLAPVVLAVVDDSLWLLPLLLLPAVAVYHGGRLSIEKQHRDRIDVLTGLPNRLAFGEEVGRALGEGVRHGRSVAVMMMDVDGFKDLNDTLGHSSGDALLRAIAERLGTALGNGSVVARLGGDEFGVLVPDLAGVGEAVDAAKGLLGQLEEPFEVDGVALDVRASVGVAVGPDHGRVVDEVIRHADVAMYVAKANRSGHEVYAPERNEHSRRRLTLLNELRPAILGRQLVLYYQPKADMRTGEVCGLEALLRWPHPTLGMVPPGEFIGLAEYTGLVRPLTELVLDEACQQLARWQEEGIAVPVAVNVSARAVHDPSFPERVRERLAEHGLPAELLVLELTESAVMAEPEAALAVMHELADMGVKLSIDDFGTGYSSLAYLSRLPVHEVKIDQSFVFHVDTHTNNRVIVESTIELARNLGLSVVAEGVETIPVWQTLARLGCTTAQGYLIARPEPEELVTELLRRQPRVPVVEPFAVRFGLNPAAGASA